MNKSNLIKFMRIEIIIYIAVMIFSACALIMLDSTPLAELTVIGLLVWCIFPISYAITGILSCIMFKNIKELFVGLIIIWILSFMMLLFLFNGLDLYSDASFIDYRDCIIRYTAITVITHIITYAITLSIKLFRKKKNNKK